MQRETAKLLRDIADMCSEIDQFSTGQTLETMLEDRGLQLILQKLVENVGEALNRVKKRDSETASRIPNYRRYIDMRNRISHGYDSIDYSIVWLVAHRQIPILFTTVVELLEEAPPIREQQ